jgi:DnaJ-class molecular chaperone
MSATTALRLPGSGAGTVRYGTGSTRMSDNQERPGDEAPPGTPGTGENLCRHCNGTGAHDGVPCETCGGTGKVIEGLAGG